MVPHRFYQAMITLSGLILFAEAQPVIGQSLGTIEITEPAEWASTTPRGLTVQQRTSFRVSGIADHPQGVRAVLLNGKKASLQLESPTRARFVGFIEVQEGVHEVRIEVQPLVGGSTSGTYPMLVGPPAPGLTVREKPGFDGERWAVVIGISDYQDPGIPDLDYAAADARAIYEFLRSPAAGLDGFEEDHIQLLINEDATYAAIRRALFTFLKNPTDDDVVVVYFAGHGTPDLDRLQNLYLLAYDSELEDISSTAFPMDDVQDAISQTFYKHLVLLTDACHSAGVGGQIATRMLGSNPINEVFLERLESSRGGYVAVTASQVNQLSQEAARWGGGHGVFTHFLLEALQGAADQDGDRIVTLGEMTEYVRDRVRRETRNAQIPTISQTAFDPYLPLAIVAAPEEEPVSPEPEPVIVEPDPVTPPAGEEETSEILTRSLFNPTQAAVKSFFIPGLGQVSTGRSGPGLGFLAGFAGALGIGLLITETQIECTSPNAQTCPAEDVWSETVERPYLDLGVGAALAISIIASWDAHRGAKRANERTRSLSEDSSPQLVAGPRITGSRGRRVAIEWIRVRF